MNQQPNRDDLNLNDAYQHPSLSCDIVIKGGITSGVTYPLAVCEVARTYTLRNIGGTSAGAIAASAAAAAELGRHSPHGGFARLAKLPERLATQPEGKDRPSVLFNLFQPSPATKCIHAILVASLGGSRLGKIRRIVVAMIAGAPLAALAGATLGLVTVVAAILLELTHVSHRSSPIAVISVVVALIAGLFLIVIGGVGGAALATKRHSLRELPKNGFGICSGYAGGEQCPPGIPFANDRQIGLDGRVAPKPLTTWLADELDGLAGLSESAELLTLGHLCHAEPSINIRMFTTNLTYGTPYTLPFRDRTFFFSPAEFRDLFPERVVKWMEGHSPPPQDQREATVFDEMRSQKPSLLPLPEPEDLPLVVMTRMSLSFPLLLSAVPLWAVATNVAAPGDLSPGPHVRGERCWFSDGGITSNFPMHFFDSPLPRWPTFGINLEASEAIDPINQENNIKAPFSNNEGVSARWQKIETLGGFAHAILDTMQNWSDNAQIRVPGYRDRIVTIMHSPSEGGMNLNMPHDFITRFSERGRAAGEFLVKRFAQPESQNRRNGKIDTLNWDNHKWIRYRTIMPLVEDLLIRAFNGYAGRGGPPWSRSYETLIEGPVDATPSYHMTVQQRERAIELTDALLALADEWGHLHGARKQETNPCPKLVPRSQRWDANRPFERGRPNPHPVIRVLRDL